METCQPGASPTLDLSSMVGGQHGKLIADLNPQTGGGKVVVKGKKVIEEEGDVEILAPQPKIYSQKVQSQKIYP